MKNRKGFTIVELVIVIAVIAILAAVLIPTFSGVVANANASAALQTARSTLSSALNMSSTGALAGENAKGIVKTAFLVDGYAFNYQGNQLEAMNYPGAAGTALLKGNEAAKANDDDNTYNFNAVLIAAQNLKKDIKSYKEADPQPNVNNFSQQTYYTQNGTDYTEAKTFADATTYYVEDEVEYSIDESISKIIDGASNIHLEANEKAIAVTVEGGRYFLNFEWTYKKTSDTALVDGKDYYTSDGSSFTKVASPAVANIGDYYERTGFKNDAEVFVNSDFSKKVVVFTTFG